VPSSSSLFDLTGNWAGFAALAIFALAYALVITEETIHLRKSKPVVVAAGYAAAIAVHMIVNAHTF